MALRLYTSASDRTSVLQLLWELLGLIGEKGLDSSKLGKEMEVNLRIEDYIPSVKANKIFWARGVDMLDLYEFLALVVVWQQWHHGGHIVVLEILLAAAK
ncbi:Hypothetical predicted protein [Olea europaea subsp. europaea]|uniref:Uncharacterized protein n=1 Tax=Olea europaea subsp. europaea TaxID=158383 RepID=A0A8S0RXH5_OLEEU|nr:Hypothetical predicted protein [Olea europaea subsp. europaea]